MSQVKAQTLANRRVEGRHREVVEAARRVIVRKGLAETRLRDVAHEGGFTTGLVTHHFPDKRAVIFGAFASAWTDWIEGSRSTFASAQNPHELARSLVQVAVPDSRELRSEWRLWAEMWAYAGGDDEFAGEIFRADTALWEQELCGVVGSLQRAGLIRSEVVPEIEATIINRLMDGLGLRAWLTGRWDEARRHFVMHLASVGFPDGLVEELLRPRTEASTTESTSPDGS
ncbi:MAG: TetR family transcriptional regulator C-terminal domain-containing protein [Actinomycetota bacterium]